MINCTQYCDNEVFFRNANETILDDMVKLMQRLTNEVLTEIP